jgi:Ca2+-binding RTX toxin-like protein
MRSWIVGTCFFVLSLSSSPALAAPWFASGATVRGDFNGDGIKELVVSSPEADGNKGAFDVVDPSTGSRTRWTRDTSGLAGAGAAAGDFFGAALAVGDFDRDGYDDLVVGAPGADDSGETDAGVIHVIYGSSSGLTTTGDQVFHQDTMGIEGVAEPGDQVGDVLTTGDFNCDGYDDVVIGVPNEEVSSGAGAGATQVLYGSSGGVSTVDNIYYQGSDGVNDIPEAGDHFGGAIAAGNFNGDSDNDIGCDDLAIASPDEDVGTVVDAGYVYTILGGTSGLSTIGDLSLHQDRLGVVDEVEESDRFGLRLYAGDQDGDGYDELVVVVPGDSCIEGHGEAVHVFHGSSSGLTAAGNYLRCDSYRCVIDAVANTYACHSYSPPVYGSGDDEKIVMFVGNDIVYGGTGDDEILGDFGDDLLFGGDGNDILDGGPGLDMLIGGSGDDVFIIDLGCEVKQGEVIDGGPGTDVIKSHLTGSQLTQLGVTIISVESYVTIPQGSGSCDPVAFEEGPFAQPLVRLSWTQLPSESSVYSTTSSTTTLEIENWSKYDINVTLVFDLMVQGYTTTFAASPIAIYAEDGDTYVLDLLDFIPGNVDPGQVAVSLLDLPTSAILSTRAEITVDSNPAGYAFAPKLFGHLENEGETVKIYRRGAYEGTYYSGDLNGWRTNRGALSGTAQFLGRIEAKVVPPP